MSAMDRYLALMHAVQSGIKFGLEAGTISNEPKHRLTGIASGYINHEAIMALLQQQGLLHVDETDPVQTRLAVDMLLVQQGPLTMLLVQKGVFSDQEYMDNLIVMAEREKENNEAALSRYYGRPVTLG